MATYGTTITDATATTAANLIAAIETLLAAQGWTKEYTGSPNIWSTTNNEGEEAYFSLYVDAAGNVCALCGAEMNSGATAIDDTQYSVERAMEFATGDDWTCYVYDENVILLRNSGVTTAKYFLTFGVLDRFTPQKQIPAAMRGVQNKGGCAAAGYVIGARNPGLATTVTTYWVYRTGAYGFEGWSGYGQPGGKSAGTLSWVRLSSAENGDFWWGSYPDGALVYEPMVVCSYFTGGLYSPYSSSLIGILPNVMPVYRDDSASVGGAPTGPFVVGDTMVPEEDNTKTYTFGFAGQDINLMSDYADCALFFLTGD